MSYIGRKPTVGNFRKCDALTASATATYNLTVDSVAVVPGSVNSMLVSLNGIIQQPTASFTISGSQIIFDSALNSSDVIDFILIYGDILDVGTVTDGTVSLAKLSATGTKDATTFLRGDNTFASAGSPSIDDNGDATAITIDSSERVGIGATSPGGDFEVKMASNVRLVVDDTLSSGVTLRSIQDSGNHNHMSIAADNIRFLTQTGSNTATEKLRILSGGGITFNGDTADANALDDYEEGTWTPTFESGGSAMSNITVSKATYTKIGRQVFVSSTCRYTGSSSTSQIIGYSLPFTSSSTTVLGVSGTFTHDPGSGNSGYIMGSVGSNGGNSNYYFVIPGGRYLSNWTQNYYLNFAFWFTT